MVKVYNIQLDKGTYCTVGLYFLPVITSIFDLSDFKR